MFVAKVFEVVLTHCYVVAKVFCVALTHSYVVVVCIILGGFNPLLRCYDCFLTHCVVSKVSWVVLPLAMWLLRCSGGF